MCCVGDEGRRLPSPISHQTHGVVCAETAVLSAYGRGGPDLLDSALKQRRSKISEMLENSVTSSGNSVPRRTQETIGQGVFVLPLLLGELMDYMILIFHTGKGLLWCQCGKETLGVQE